MASGVSPYTCRNSSYGLRMANKKNKKEINIKGFPGYDFHLTVIIIIGVLALGILKACK